MSTTFRFGEIEIEAVSDGILKTNIDTVKDMAREKARAEEDLRASNARLEALLGEVNHRVANSLQLVSAMVRLQAGALADPTARAALDDTQRRIGAIAQCEQEREEFGRGAQGAPGIRARRRRGERRAIRPWRASSRGGPSSGGRGARRSSGDPRGAGAGDARGRSCSPRPCRGLRRWRWRR